MITVTICAALCGADDWVAIERFGKAKEAWFQGFLELPWDKLRADILICKPLQKFVRMRHHQYLTGVHYSPSLQVCWALAVDK
ncbi:transposase family protein [Zooshikella sp. WH53]|uniref:Transposase family protein n=1 Tax=Zooshikella harenae TaxID=2827238 RepID=A0ABS5ZIA2_9GAMM|nr:transposase family protein [Zooshikella harenae]